ncbi:MAG TPA: hypothetical protein VIC35_13645 [Acidimicrobiia bacterium]
MTIGSRSLGLHDARAPHRGEQAVPDPLLALAREREPTIVLTAPWHERDAKTLVEQLDAAVFAPPADTAQDLIDKYGITAEQAGDGSPDPEWLRSAGNAHWYAGGDRLPVGIEAYAGREHNDLVLWIESVRAVVAGDWLADFGDGLAIQEQWLRQGVTREQLAEGLGPLLALPVELVLPAHGEPTDHAALERALS